MALISMCPIGIPSRHSIIHPLMTAYREGSRLR